MVFKSPQCLALLLLVAIGAFCVTIMTTTDGAETEGSQKKAAPVSLEAYAAARARAINLAESVAKDRYERIVVTHTKRGERFDGSETPLLKELVAVTWDSWRFLRDEWQRVRASTPGEERDLRMAIIAHSWSASQDERALGLLAEQAIENRRGYYRVEKMTRVYHGMLSEMTAADMAAYHERFSKWWKSYEPNWRATMAHKAEVRSLAMGEKRKGVKPGEPEAIFPGIKPVFMFRVANLRIIEAYCQQRDIRRLGRDRVRLFIQPMGVVAEAIEIDLTNRQLTVYPGTHSKKKIVQTQLDEEQSAQIRALVTSDKFKKTPRENKTIGFDGTSYLVEVSIGGAYSWKLHWVPDDKEFMKVIDDIRALARKKVSEPPAAADGEDAAAEP